ncbi:MAG: hypothetical protein QM758_22755 [Armatimonas sp.]
MALSRKLFLGCTTVGLGVPLLTLSGGLLWTVQTFGGDSQRLEEERATARREGVPLTGEDLRSDPIPDEENAAILIRQVMKLWPESKRNRDEAPFKNVLKGTATEAERTEARAVLARLAPILNLAHEAANRPSCNFEYDLNKGAALLLPEMAPMRAMGRLLCYESALEDSPEKSFATIQATARLARHAASAPILICGLVQVAISTMAHRQFALTLARFGKPALPHALTALSAWEEPRPLTYFLGGESVFYHITAQQFIDGKLTFQDLSDNLGASMDGPIKPVGFPPVVGPMVMRAWATRGLVYWRGAYKLLRENEGDAARAHAAFLAYSTYWGDSWDRDHDPKNILLAILAPVYSQAIDKLYVLPLAERRLRETMLALIEANGKDVLLPPDPYATDNAPLKLRREGKGFTLWSIGQDHVDNGGVRDKDKRLNDLVVTYPG